MAVAATRGGSPDKSHFVMRRGRVRGLTDSERLLWRVVTRDAAPLSGRVVEPLPPQPSADPVMAPASLPPTMPKPGHTPLAPLIVRNPGARHVPGIDRRTSDRLKRGQLPIDGRLDLHGMTRDAAHAALNSFIANAYRRGARALLVITGKGMRQRTEIVNFWEPERTGVLRREVPHWLQEGENRSRILAVTQAQPEHGGSGALYVLLRRQRP